MMLGKWIKIAVLFFSVFFLWNYGPFYFTKQEREWRKERQEERKARAEYTSYVNEIRHTFGKKMLEEFYLVPSGQSGMMHQKVEMLGMEFTAYRRATIEEARNLQLIAMDQFVKAINAHEKIHSFLDEQPFSYKRITIAINFKGPNGRYCDGSVANIWNIDDLAGRKENRNRIFYYAVDPYKDDMFKVHNELYEDALKIVNSSTDLNPYVHKTTPMEKAIDQMSASFVKEMKENYHLKCSSIGGKMPNMVEEIGANLVLVKHTSQEEARKLLLAVTKRLIETLNLSHELRPFLIEHPFPTNRLKLRISFTRNNHFSYYDGSMESMTLEKDKITYFKIPPEDRLVRSIPFDEESYQEAQQKDFKEHAIFAGKY